MVVADRKGREGAEFEAAVPGAGGEDGVRTAGLDPGDGAHASSGIFHIEQSGEVLLRGLPHNGHALGVGLPHTADVMAEWPSSMNSARTA